VVVVGATGNVGTSVLDALGRDDSVTSILGLARRLPATEYPKTRFAAADVTRDELASHFDGAGEELGWSPAHSAAETVRELLLGLAAKAGGGTPPLRSGDRRAELAAGIGRKPL
jgi:nucleoside-diphosphate-sugar epimerase